FAPLDWSKAAKMVFGTLQFQTTPSLTTATGSQGWASYVNGQMDQVRVYNKVLSVSEVSALYNLEKLGR
ncbi:MAG: LamG domain-containing protein, partial [Mucilaginibacter sp.]